MSEIVYNHNDPALLTLSTVDSMSMSNIQLNVDDDFLTRLKGAYSDCKYFNVENTSRQIGQGVHKSSDGLF